jgi:hypothetical protein
MSRATGGPSTCTVSGERRRDARLRVTAKSGSARGQFWPLTRLFLRKALATFLLQRIE